MRYPGLARDDMGDSQDVCHYPHDRYVHGTVEVSGVGRVDGQPAEPVVPGQDRYTDVRLVGPVDRVEAGRSGDLQVLVELKLSVDREFGNGTVRIGRRAKHPRGRRYSRRI